MNDNSENFIALDALKMACPKLSSLHVISSGITAIAWQTWMEHWREDIKTFTWLDLGGLSFDGMFTVASHFIHLTFLHLGSFNMVDMVEPESTGSTQIYVIPSLRWLIINRLCIRGFDISKLTCPSLEWLSITVPDGTFVEKADKFVQRHSETITGLDIVTGDEVNANEIISGPMVSTPLLKTLILSLPTFQFPISHSNTTDYHPTLRTLYLRVNNPALVGQLRDFILNIKQEKFRRLELVILVIHPQFDRDGMSVIRRLMAEPPAGTSVVVQDDPTRYGDDEPNGLVL